MTQIVPFCTTMSEDRAAPWLSVLNAALSGVRVVPFTEVTEAEREAARVAVVANPDPAELSALPHLEWVQSLWAGVERLVAELDNPAVQIARLVDPDLSQSMAEAVLSHVLYLHRRYPDYAAQQRAHVWDQLPPTKACDRTVAVLGLGELGRVAAQRVLGQGFKVIGWSRRERQIEGLHCLHGAEGFAQALRQADIIVLLLPLTPATRGLFSAEVLTRCKPGAQIVNVARGALIEDNALRDALDDGHIGHAVLDVFHQEPLSPDAWFWTHPSVTVMPHVAALTDPQTAGKIVADNLANFFFKETLPKFVDMQNGY